MIYLLPHILVSKHMEVGVIIIFVPFQTSLFSMKLAHCQRLKMSGWVMETVLIKGVGTTYPQNPQKNTF